MCHNFLKNASFFESLYQLDLILAQDMKNSPCSFCGGKLDQAKYYRKPRGIPNHLNLDPTFNLAFSFCCRRDGCRKRHRASSTRFLGRFVYLSAFIILATCLFNGITDKRYSILSKKLNIDRSVLKRWKKWWDQNFTKSLFWKDKSALFKNELSLLPNSLLDYFLNYHHEYDHSLKILLQFLSPYPKVFIHNNLRTL